MRFLLALLVCLAGAAGMSAPIPDARPLRLPFTLKGHKDRVTSVAFSPDSKRIVSGSMDKTVNVWETATGKLLLTARGHTAKVQSAAFSPDGKRIVSGSAAVPIDPEDNTVRVWDARTGRILLTLKGHSAGVYSVAFRPDGKMMASGSEDTTIILWDVKPGKK